MVPVVQGESTTLDFLVECPKQGDGQHCDGAHLLELLPKCGIQRGAAFSNCPKPGRQSRRHAKPRTHTATWMRTGTELSGTRRRKSWRADTVNRLV